MTLRLYAIGIDEVREVVGADDELADRLRAVAAAAFPPSRDTRTGKLGWLGPLFRTGPRRVRDPADPTADDVTALLRGGFVPPERGPAAWRLMQAWLDDLSWGHVEHPFSQTSFDDLDFALARAGLPSPFALGTLLGNDAQLPLRPSPGMSVGYAKHRHVLAVRDALAATEGSLKDMRADEVATLRGFLDQFDGWSADAAAAGRPTPDLMVIWTR